MAQAAATLVKYMLLDASAAVCVPARRHDTRSTPHAASALTHSPPRVRHPACVLQEECAEKQLYIRRLEAKLEELQGAADLASKHQAAKQKVAAA